MKSLTLNYIVEQPDEAKRLAELRKQIELEDAGFTRIKILNEDAEKLKEHAERLGIDESMIVHRLLYWYGFFKDVDLLAVGKEKTK